jgi:hypothetical protein
MQAGKGVRRAAHNVIIIILARASLSPAAHRRNGRLNACSCKPATGQAVELIGDINRMGLNRGFPGSFAATWRVACGPLRIALEPRPCRTLAVAAGAVCTRDARRGGQTPAIRDEIPHFF